jgi:hypothetical protein
MKEKKIFDAVTQVDDEIIEEARVSKLERQAKLWKKWMALAASLIVVLAVGRAVLFSIPFGGSAGGDRGHSEGSVFMSYAGPVFPLTLSEDTGIKAVRNIDFDFSPYIPRKKEHETHDGEIKSYMVHDNEIVVGDDYILTNPTDQEIKMEGVYPFAGSMNDDEDIIPVITINGSKTKAVLNPGPYTGGFQGVYGNKDTEENKTLNLAYIDSWEGYKALLTSGEYMERAFDEFPDFDKKVAVYEFSNITADHENGVNPTLNIEFNMDFDKSIIFTYGFNGGSLDYGNNYASRHFSVPEETYSNYGMPRYLIVMGEDIDDYIVKGYPDGGCVEGEEIEGISANIDRYETTLGQALWNVMEVYNKYYEYEDKRVILDTVSDEVQYGLVKELLQDFGILSEEPMDRYDIGMLEDVISEVREMDRVFYLSFELVIPPGESISLEANMVKEYSFDYYDSGSDNMDIDGYDMVTGLGSNLTFTEETASIQDQDLIEIVRQNFGFDLENGVRKVILDPAEERYYMEISPKASEE